MFGGRPGGVGTDQPQMGGSPGSTFALNDLGLRINGTFERAKKPGEFRVFVLGASTVFNGAPLANSIPGRLEALCHDSGLDSVAVYNCGVVSYVSGQELALLLHTTILPTSSSCMTAPMTSRRPISAIRAPAIRTTTRSRRRARRARGGARIREEPGALSPLQEPSSALSLRPVFPGGGARHESLAARGASRLAEVGIARGRSVRRQPRQDAAPLRRVWIQALRLPPADRPLQVAAFTFGGKARRGAPFDAYMERQYDRVRADFSSMGSDSRAAFVDASRVFANVDTPPLLGLHPREQRGQRDDRTTHLPRARGARIPTYARKYILINPFPFTSIGSRSMKA